MCMYIVCERVSMVCVCVCVCVHADLSSISCVQLSRQTNIPMQMYTVVDVHCRHTNACVYAITVHGRVAFDVFCALHTQ